MPYFVISPNALTSLVGFLHGPDDTVPTPREDWRDATVDVVIPAHNEERNIVLCLASLARQTRPPQRIILIDDGSADGTLDLAREYCEAVGLELIAIRRSEAIGKTPTIKRQAREFDSDVEFILDGDTVLESTNYIERTVEELYKGVGIASSCGVIRPLRNRDRRECGEWSEVREFLDAHPDASIFTDVTWFQRVRHGITNIYRDALYLFLQRFVYKGQMVFFGTISNPVGCAVAYRREYVKDLFDHYEPVLGDDLTNSEDIFIGFALLDKGYRNIQLEDVCARSVEPEAQRLPRQIYMWSSSFLQTCYYFNSLLLSPFKAPRRRWHQWKTERLHGEEIREKRKVQEPYRQAFGREYTRRYGRPIGWSLLMSVIEKIGFPVALLLMILFQAWEPLLVTMAFESALALFVLVLVAKGERFSFFWKGLFATPIRYGYIAFDLFTIGWFATDIWFRKNRKWRK